MERRRALVIGMLTALIVLPAAGAPKAPALAGTPRPEAAPVAVRRAADPGPRFDPPHAVPPPAPATAPGAAEEALRAYTAAGGPRPAVVTTARAVLVGEPESLLREIAAEVEPGIDAVSRVWGEWPRRVVLFLARDRDHASALAGTQAGEFAAIASGGDRVVLAPGPFGRLSPAGRRVVLRHELAHVATRAANTPSLPGWLLEGFADYVGYRDAGIPVPVAARELAEEVRAGRSPERLPGRAAFEAHAARLPQAYEEAWLACRMIADRWGETVLVRLYGQMARDPSETTLRRVLGIGTPELTRLWREHLTATLW
ncbi:hypothetical protein [Bailinhaonella thermotolerans]|nr:hypothetical protein [Bailinhaonella thermotolerans]